MPRIGGYWGQCDPQNPRNRRRRVSILVEEGDATVLVDTSPDMREQLLDAGVQRLDAVLYTHAHADHAHGIDDLRSINRLTGQALPIYASAVTLAEYPRRFGYVLAPLKAGLGGVFYKPPLDAGEIEGPFEVAGLLSCRSGRTTASRR